MSGETAKFCGGCCLLTFVVSVILFALSFSTLDVHQVGIKYNNNLMTIDEENVYNNGRHFLGLGLNFIEFPTNMVEISFTGADSVRAWSHEGQNLGIEMNFYYRIERDQIIQLYRRYGEDYHQRYKVIALSVIKKVTTLYEATEFFLERQQITAHIKLALQQRFSIEFATVELFNLRQINVPDMFESKIIDKVVKAQEYQTALNIAKTAVLRAEVDVIRREGTAAVNLKLARARAESQRDIEFAKARAIAQLATAESESYAKLASELGLSPAQSTKYRYAQTLTAVEEGVTGRSTNFILGFDGTVSIG